jgi:hypothetical protein
MAILLALFIGLGPAAAQDDSAAEIQKYVKALRGSDADLRRDAEEWLTAIGEPAEPALKEVAAGKDPEVARRARNILEGISLEKLSRSIEVTQRARIALTGTAAKGVAWSPDGKLLAGAGQNGTITIWKAFGRSARSGPDPWHETSYPYSATPTVMFDSRLPG